jgi:curved DNA-binding protein CbpA
LDDAFLDERAMRELVATRRALVDEGDYFQLLGVGPHATAYDIRRAYVELKRTFQTGRLAAPAVADLRDDVALITSVLDEAYDILHDHTRRERYRRALLSSPE